MTQPITLQEHGRKLGQSNRGRKSPHSAENGKKGGRPKGSKNKKQEVK